MTPCRACGKPLIVGDNWSESCAKHHDYICLACKAAKSVSYYQANRERINTGRRKKYSTDKNHRANVSTRNKHYRAANREQLNAKDRERRRKRLSIVRRYKHMKGCIVCGERRTDCLDLHAPKGHDICVAKLVGRNTWAATRAEIRKCVVVCANCHRLIHAGKINL